MPRAPHGTAQPAIRFGIVYKLLLNRIPVQLSSERHGYISLLIHGLRAYRGFHWTDCPLTRPDGIQQIALMIVTPDHANLVRSDPFSSQSRGIGHHASPADVN